MYINFCFKNSRLVCISDNVRHLKGGLLHRFLFLMTLEFIIRMKDGFLLCNSLEMLRLFIKSQNGK